MLNRFRILLIPIFALLGVARIIVSGFEQDQYLLYVCGITTEQPYPFQGVAIFSAITIAESLVFFFILRPKSYSRSWRRALAAFSLAVGLLFFWGLSVMHAPPYMLSHVFWFFIGVALLFVLLAVSLFFTWQNKAHNRVSAGFSPALPTPPK